MSDPTQDANVSASDRVRPTSFRLCQGIGKDGAPCRMAALRGEAHCRHHSAKLLKARGQAGVELVPVLPISSLIHLNVVDPGGMERFRRGLMAHVARGTLDGVQVKHLHELAMAIRDDAPKVKTTRTRDLLRDVFTTPPRNESEGEERPTPHPREAEIGGEGGKGPTALPNGTIEVALPPPPG